MCISGDGHVIFTCLMQHTLPADGVKYNGFLKLLQQADKDSLPANEVTGRFTLFNNQ